MNLVQHSDTWIPSEEIGNQIPPYRPTFRPNPWVVYINDNHKALAEGPLDANGLLALGIPGWLRPEDGLKLYEMAYYSAGDVLEIGSYQGLSTSLLARAIADSAEPNRVVISVDLDPAYVAAAQRHIDERDLTRYVKLNTADAVAFAQRLIDAGRHFNFVFVDHSHAYQDMIKMCELLPALVVSGGFCLFHDYNDARNRDIGNADYGVSRAVRETLNPSDFEFYGIFGCTGLYRRK